MEEVSRASGSVGLSYGAHSNLCVNQIFRWGNAGAEGALPAEAHLGRAPRRARHVGGGRRLGRGLHAAPGREARRPLRPERHANSGSPTGRRRTRSSSTPRPIPTPARAGITAFIVEKTFPGFSVAQKLDKLGMRGSETGELVFRGLRGAGGERARQGGGGGPRADVRPRLRAHRARRRAARADAGGARRRDRPMCTSESSSAGRSASSSSCRASLPTCMSR